MKKKICVALLCLAGASACAAGLTACAPNKHKAHVYDQTVAESQYLKSEATCTEKAVYYLSCECGEAGTETFEYGEKLAHDRDDGKTLSDSTCSKQGEVEYKCKVCGNDCGTEKLPLLPHTYKLEDGYWNLDGYAVADDTRSAVIPYSCSVCKQNFADAYTDSLFDFAADKIRLEDKYSTETAVILDSENKYLFINLAGGDKALAALSEENLYDANTKILTLPARYKSVSVEKVKIAGFRTPRNDFAISTQISNKMTVIMKNINYTAPQGTAGLNLSNIINASLEIEGLVEINGASGAVGVNAKNLTIKGAGDLCVSGGSAVNSTNGNGKSGGTGLSAEQLTLSLEDDSNATFIGGNGGAAYNRPYSDNDGEGHNGRDGYNGGNGGFGIKAAGITVTGGAYVVVGGNGGRGGDGSECNRSEITNKGSTNVVGGNGGNGGNGSYAVQTDKITISAGSLSVAGGNGGDSGKIGGCHDNDYSGWVFGNGTTTAQDGKAGKSGKGAEGLSECTVEGDDELITSIKGSNGTVVTQKNQNV